MSPGRDTIFAHSSGRPPAAIAVVRISGPRAGVALEKLTGRLPSPRQAALARVRDPANGEIIDEALVLWFPAPRSETGEDMAELQLHGGRAIIAAVLAVLGKLEGFRPADAGEFTRRAFENGRLDLTAVEGLADLIGAETETQRRQAFRQLKGILGGQAEAWRKRLIEALALVEAGIDFSDEADVPQDLLRPALDIARLLHEEICAVLTQAGRGERLRDGLVVAIAGPPNAGKSTLLNRIARREAAIVSPYAGTTRDVIEVHLDLDGYPVTLLDTAGVRESDDPVEQEGVRRARERAAAADLVLWVVEADRPTADAQRHSQPAADRPNSSVGAEMAGPLADLMRTTPVWLIRNKTDLPAGHNLDQSVAEEEPFFRTSGSKGAGIQFSPDRPAADLASAPSGSPTRSGSAVEARGAFPGAAAVRSPTFVPAAPASVPGRAASPPAPPAGASVTSAALAAGPAFAPAPASFSSGAPLPAGAVPTNTRSEYEINNEFKFIYNLSAQQGIGLAELLEALRDYARAYFGSESGLITRERHRHALQEAQAALARALAEGPHREEILAEELRLASRALGRLTGKVDVEDILDVIFRDFCIGK